VVCILSDTIWNLAAKREEMKNIALLTLSLFLVTGTAFADAPNNDESQAAAPAKTTKKAPKKPDAVAQQLEELRQALQAQQAQLQALKEELAKRDRQIDEAREAAAAANSRAAEASSKATEAATATAEVKSSESSLNSTVSDLKVSNEALKSTVEKEEAAAKKAAVEGPPAIRYKGITITPGGFVAAETVSRTRALSGDINTPFSILYPGASLTKVSENSFTSRQSRLSLLAESKVGDSAKLTGYYEADWLGTGVTSNNRQSNSYVLRQRQIWAQAAFENGFSVTGGQTWSLATENKQGIQTRGEAIPLTVDSQYNVGFTWARQYGFRIVKSFGGKFALALAVEGPQATIGGRGFSLATTTTVGTAAVATTGNTFLDAPGAGAGLLNFSDTTGYSVNKAPDIIVKAAADPGFGHYELFGILSTFRNRVFPCGVVGTNAKDTVAPATTTTLNCAPDPSNPNPVPSSLGAYDDTRIGGGLGASLRVPLFSKKLDFGVKGVAGDGIGRYGSAQIADLTFRPNGTEALIRTAHGLGVLEFHPNAKLDVYAYFGGEYGWRAAYQGYNSITITKTPAIPVPGSPPTTIAATTTTTFKKNQIGGYGSPFANNSGCGTENPPSNQLTPSGGGSCAGDTRAIYEGTLGFWYKFYQSPKGGLRLGLQYSYFSRNGWSGNNSATGTSTAAGISPKAVDNMVWTSLRYYIP
jgi:hypothetical protein